MIVKTADLCDRHGDQLQVVDPIFHSYGGRPAFAGRIATVKVHEDNKLVRAELEKDGSGQVLVIDGGGSLRAALVGGNIAKLAADNRWSGIIVYGCIRDAIEVAEAPIGVLALAACPVKPKKNGFGEVGVAVHFGGVTFKPGGYVYADEDGVVVAPGKLN
ncbi:MAG TPA: ribonuclease E activity regulator RraA [Burkholderiales bacterium]|jgi:regulator of ribonuclease activity A